jgi:methylated-DNA-protein-cysteine methyltransferase-like protein
MVREVGGPRAAALPRRSREDPAVDPGERDDAVVAVLRELLPGEVVSYGDVADDAGFPGRARAVGRLLAAGVAGVPWWRVVSATGRLVPGHEEEHAARLRAEGVTVCGGRVVRSPLGRFAPPPPRCRG